MKSSDAVRERGFVLITMLLLLSVLTALLGAYLTTSKIELATTRHSKQSITGFYAAEAGLNMRAEEIRQAFLGYNLPSGTTPSGTVPCEDGSQGAGDYICKNYDLGSSNTVTYVTPDPSNPITTTIPPGERYQNLNAQEFRYTVNSVAKNDIGSTQALLELRFKSRLVPMFQFMAFFDKDLEILPGPTMTMNGPIHTNGDLYLNTDNSNPGLSVTGQITTAGRLWRGRKNQNLCNSNPVKVKDPTTLRTLVPTCSTRKELFTNDVTNWNGMIQIGVDDVDVPEPEDFDPVAGASYWKYADLRLVLRRTAGDLVDTSNAPSGVEVRNEDDTVDVGKTNTLNNAATCPGSLTGGRVVGNSQTMFNNRESKYIRMLEVDMRALLTCLHTTNWFGTGKRLDDATQEGLVFYLTVSGPQSNNLPNWYGVRVRNASPLRSTVGNIYPKGISIISNQAAYSMGNFNAANKIPAAIMADSYQVLSGNWNDANSSLALGNRTPTATTVNAAILAGSDTTGNVEGSGGQNGAYNGGLENFPRFHENWSNINFTYLGSFVSLNKPRHYNGVWVYGSPYYNAPNRIWAYDTMFNDATKLPPMTPRFVYLRQELFVRDYEQ